MKSNRYKVLCFKSSFLHHIKRLGKPKKIDPVFKRTGLYYDRYTRQAWIELQDAKTAYVIDSSFFHDLIKKYNTPKLSKKHYDALCELAKYEDLPQQMADKIKYESDIIRRKRDRLKVKLLLFKIKKENNTIG